MKTYLNDFEEMALSSIDEAHEFMLEREKEDKWFEPFINELSVRGIPLSSPLLIPAIKADITDFVGTEDMMAESMDPDYGSMGLLLHCPNPRTNGAATFPIRYTAISSLFERAGIGGKTIRNVKESQYVDILSPEEKADILNKMLSLYADKCRILIRDGKIATVRSKQYEVLHSSELADELELAMGSEWSSFEYVNGVVSHEYLRLMYMVNDAGAETKLASMLAKTYLQGQEVKIGFMFCTSDVGNSTAKVQPVLFYRTDDTEPWQHFPFGMEQGMKHSSGSSLKKWETQILPRIGVLVQEMGERIDVLSKQRITYPGDCLRKLCFELKLPKKAALEVSEEFENSYQRPTAIDVYFFLFEVIAREELSRDKGFTPSQKLRYSEAAASAILLDIKEMDIPFSWT